MPKSKKRDRQSSQITFTAMVAASDLRPLVQVAWGTEQGQLTPAQARDHAFAVLSAIAAAELDACLVQWAVQKLGVPFADAGKLLQLFREKREKGFHPQTTLNIDGERVTPDAAKQYASWLMDAAFQAEIESLIAVFLIDDLNQTPQAINQIIEEFREMRGATTLWPSKQEPDQPD